jgi:hypothetical protein
MPSQINSIYLNIDQDYPVAGIDNDTQGFRDNFDIIKTGLGFAGQEITVLQDTTAKINEENNFFGNVVNNVDLFVATEKSFPGIRFETGQGNGVVLFSNGNHQRIVLSAIEPAPGQEKILDMVLEVSWSPTTSSNLDEDRYAKIVVEVVSETNDEINVSWIADGGADVKYSNNWPSNFKATTNPQFVEVSTFNGGNTMFVRYLGEYTDDGNLLGYYRYQSLTQEISPGVTTPPSTSNGSISLEVMSAYFETSSNEDSSLQAGAPGQIKTLIMRSHGGNMNVSVAAAGWVAGAGINPGVIVFTATGQACTLQFIVDKWYCIGNNGATFT